MEKVAKSFIDSFANVQGIRTTENKCGYKTWLHQFWVLTNSLFQRLLTSIMMLRSLPCNILKNG